MQAVQAVTDPLSCVKDAANEDVTVLCSADLRLQSIEQLQYRNTARCHERWFDSRSDTQRGHPFHFVVRRTIVLGSVGLDPDESDETDLRL